jgi:putative ABC transport system ATP-binding protein
MSLAPVIQLHELTFSWSHEAEGFSIADFSLAAGEMVFLYGPSGCGKSTFLNLLAGVLLPQRGELHLLNQSMMELSQRQRDQFRADHIGLIFQQFNLLPYLSVMDNLLLPLTFSPLRLKRLKALNISAEAKALELLAHLGLETDVLNQPVSNLSVGQQQRVAAARALLGAPELIIADEPTSALDEGNQQRFVDLLKRECVEQNTALILVSHDRRLAQQFDRAIDFPSICQRISL